MNRYSTEVIEIDGREKTRYEWTQEMRRQETQVRRMKDTAILAQAAGDGALERQCRSGIERTQNEYERMCQRAGLKPDWTRMHVWGYGDLQIKQTGGAETYLEKINRRDREALKEYNMIRGRDDISLIAKASGMTEKEIRAIKDHVFFDEHKLYDGIGRCDPDYDMAVAWNRLTKGRPEKRDLLLLRHELLETQLEKKYNLTLSEAHARATELYDWSGLMTELFGEEGEQDDLL